MNVDDIERIRELRRQGKYLQEIGDLFGINYLTVRIYVDQEFKDRKSRRRDIKYIGVRRPKPEECELCSTVARLESHHWDNNAGNICLYLCWDCHRYAEVADYDETYGEGRRRDYISTKRREEEDYRKRSEDYKEGREGAATPPSPIPPDQITVINNLRLKIGRSKEPTNEAIRFSSP